MKKLTVLILALSMIVSLFAACGQKKTLLDTAAEYLEAMYKQDNGTATPDDYKLVGVVNISGTSFNVTWSSDADDVKIVPDADGKMVTVDVNEQSPAEVAYTLTATIADAEGKTATCTFTHTVPEFKVLTVAEVVALDDGAAAVLKGTVTAIDTAWSDQYKNISVYVEDEAGSKILCYRLGTNVTVGDVLIVKGFVGSYNGAKQIAAGATAEIVDHVEVKVDFPETTLADANAAEDGTNVTVTGVVVNIAEKDAWSDKYNNMSVTITDGEDTLYIYRLATKVELNDVIVIKGAIGSYKGTKQIAAGATAEITGTHKEVSLADANATDDGVLVIVKGTVKEIAEKDAWSDKYNNMSVTIEDADGNTLYIYRLGTKVELGDEITVYGAVGSYKGTKQIAAGGFAVISEDVAA